MIVPRMPWIPWYIVGIPSEFSLSTIAEHRICNRSLGGNSRSRSFRAGLQLRSSRDSCDN
jgi:hypothetical protein